MDKKEEKKIYDKVMSSVSESAKNVLGLNESEGETPDLSGIQTVEQITREQFYNPALNSQFSGINDDFIYLSEDGKVGMDVHIQDKTGDGGKEDFVLYADSMGLLLEHFDIAVEASVEDVHDKFFRIWCEPVTHKFWKGWKKNCMQTDEQVDALEEQIDDFYVNVIQDAKTPADIMNGMLAL